MDNEPCCFHYRKKTPIKMLYTTEVHRGTTIITIILACNIIANIFKTSEPYREEREREQYSKDAYLSETLAGLRIDIEVLIVFRVVEQRDVLLVRIDAGLFWLVWLRSLLTRRWFEGGEKGRRSATGYVVSHAFSESNTGTMRLFACNESTRKTQTRNKNPAK